MGEKRMALLDRHWADQPALILIAVTPASPFSTFTAAVHRR